MCIDMGTNTKDLELFNNTLDIVRKYSPGHQVLYKDESKFQKFLAKLLFFLPNYLTGFTTTFFRRTWFSSRKDVELYPSVFAETMAHEGVHAADEHREGLFFHFAYLFPQIFALLSLLSVLAAWKIGFLGCLVFLLFLAPLPSSTRTAIELRGYAMTMAFNYWLLDLDPIYSKGIIMEQFLGSSYYWMWPFKKNVSAKLDDVVEDIKSGVICAGKGNEIFKDVKKMIEKYRNDLMISHNVQNT